MKKKILITGANGVIGTVLRKGLSNYSLTSFSSPENDVCDYKKLVQAMRGHFAVIHLAWNTKKENYGSQEIDFDNHLMTYHVYRAALEAKVSRVIMASSVHADNFASYHGKKRLFPTNLTWPDSPYGASKVFMEALGRYYATKGLDVICIRFGGVNKENKVPKIRLEQKVWLSHQDCVSAVLSCLTAKKVPHHFVLFYAVSKNKGRVHDVFNPFGWKPQDGS